MKTVKGDTPEEYKMSYFEEHKEAFTRAYHGISFDPEGMGRRQREYYEGLLQDDLEYLRQHSTSTGKYAEKFVSRVLGIMARESRCVSSFIAGPSNYPVASQQKKRNSVERACEEFSTWRSRYISKATAKPRPKPEAVIERELENIDKLEILHWQASVYNEYYKNKEGRTAREVYESVRSVCGIELDHFCTIAGVYTAWATSKMESISEVLDTVIPLRRASLSRKGILDRTRKVEEMRARIAVRDSFEPIEFDGGRIDIENDRVVIYHDERPDQEVITRLKRNGFRWSPKWGCSCRQHTPVALRVAKQLVGV